MYYEISKLGSYFCIVIRYYKRVTGFMKKFLKLT